MEKVLQCNFDTVQKNLSGVSKGTAAAYHLLLKNYQLGGLKYTG